MPSVVIVGSGLVGAATALALSQVGITCTLYDQVDLAIITEGKAVDFGDSGGSVLIQAGGLRVLQTLGVLDECLAAGNAARYGSTSKIDGSSKVIADMKTWNKTAGETDPKLQVPLQILRSKLLSILMQACYRNRVKTFVGKKLVDVQQNGESATAIFADGTTAKGDLVIGADGIHSATRRKVFGNHLVAKFTGEMGHIGVVRTKDNGIVIKDIDECAFYVDRDKKYQVVVYKVSEEIGAVRVTTFNDPVPEEGDEEQYRPYTDLPKHAGRLADLLHSWGVPPYVEKMMRCSFRLSSASIYDLPDLETYRNDRVILIGDAAHGMVPNAGIGLLTGLEDVGTLLAIFRRYPKLKDWDKALDLYSKLRVPRGCEASARARSMRDKGLASSVFGGGFNHFMLGLVVSAANAGYFTLYTVYDSEVEVAKMIEQDSK